MCTAWAMVDLSTLPTLHAARTVSVPLRGGPLAHRLTLEQCATAVAAAALQQGHPAQAAVAKAARGASLAVTMRPVPAQDTAAALLPPLAVVAAPVARVVALYRQLLAGALGTAEARDGPGIGCCVR